MNGSDNEKKTRMRLEYSHEIMSYEKTNRKIGKMELIRTLKENKKKRSTV